MDKNRIYTIEDWRKYDPCYAKEELAVLKDRFGTISDWLQMEDIPAIDRIWLLTRTDVIPCSMLIQFVENCIAEVLKPLSEYKYRYHQVYQCEEWANEELENLREVREAAPSKFGDPAYQAAMYVAAAYKFVGYDLDVPRKKQIEIAINLIEGDWDKYLLN